MKIPQKRPVTPRESMRLSFRGSEWWAIELDALYDHTDLAREKLLRDMAYAKRPSTSSAVAIHLRDTLVTAHLAATLASELCTGGTAIRKTALVGLSGRAKRLVSAALRNTPPSCTVAFFSDYEKAKQWLIP